MKPIVNTRTANVDTPRAILDVQDTVMLAFPPVGNSVADALGYATQITTSTWLIEVYPYTSRRRHRRAARRKLQTFADRVLADRESAVTP